MRPLRLSAAATALHVSVSQLAAAVGLQRPISLRELLQKAGSRWGRIRVCLLRYDSQKPRPGAALRAKWPDAFCEAVFGNLNGWSVSSYWNRCAFGLIDLHFELQPCRMLPHGQAQEDDDRGAILRICKEQATADGVKLDGFDTVIAFVHPPPNNAGATGGGAVFDQGGFIEFFEHEMGRVPSYQHAFGAQGFSALGAFDPVCGAIGDDVYEDPWCVMGFTGLQSRPVVPPPEFSAGPTGVRNFWGSGRRLCSAALYRYWSSTPFHATPSAFEIHSSGDPRTGLAEVTLLAASEGRRLDPIVAVVPGKRVRFLAHGQG